MGKSKFVIVMTKEVPSNRFITGQNQLSNKKINVPAESGSHEITLEK